MDSSLPPLAQLYPFFFRDLASYLEPRDLWSLIHTNKELAEVIANDFKVQISKDSFFTDCQLTGQLKKAIAPYCRTPTIEIEDIIGTRTMRFSREMSFLYNPRSRKQKIFMHKMAKQSISHLDHEDLAAVELIKSNPEFDIVNIFSTTYRKTNRQPVFNLFMVYNNNQRGEINFDGNVVLLEKNISSALFHKAGRQIVLQSKDNHLALFDIDKNQLSSWSFLGTTPASRVCLISQAIMLPGNITEIATLVDENTIILHRSVKGSEFTQVARYYDNDCFPPESSSIKFLGVLPNVIVYGRGCGSAIKILNKHSGQLLQSAHRMIGQHPPSLTRGVVATSQGRQLSSSLLFERDGDICSILDIMNPKDPSPHILESKYSFDASCRSIVGFIAMPSMQDKDLILTSDGSLHLMPNVKQSLNASEVSTNTIEGTFPLDQLDQAVHHRNQHLQHSFGVVTFHADGMIVYWRTPTKKQKGMCLIAGLYLPPLKFAHCSSEALIYQDQNPSPTVLYLSQIKKHIPD